MTRTATCRCGQLSATCAGYENRKHGWVEMIGDDIEHD
jgi:hypothetical protein